jgi:hypothetical protein
MKPYLAELAKVREASGGTLPPENVVAFAADPKTALHSQFEWDDTIAGREHRLFQARQLIAAVVHILPSHNGSPIKVKAFISLPSDRRDGVGYRCVEDVIKDDRKAKELLDMLLDDIQRLQVKYAAFRSLWPVMEAISKAVEQTARASPPKSRPGSTTMKRGQPKGKDGGRPHL